MQVAKLKTCRLCAVSITIAWCALLVGCGGSNLATIRGNVTLDGTPLEVGSIVFEPADRTGPVAGGTIKDGKYLLAGDSGVVPGKKIVRINASRNTGRKIEAGPPAPAGTLVDEVVYVPDSYNEKSTLSVQVESGASSHDFELRSTSGGK